MSPSARYWLRFVGYIVVGLLLGLGAGLVVETMTRVAGWALWSATLGALVGLSIFLFTSVNDAPSIS